MTLLIPENQEVNGTQEMIETQEKEGTQTVQVTSLEEIKLGHSELEDLSMLIRFHLTTFFFLNGKS